MEMFIVRPPFFSSARTIYAGDKIYSNVLEITLQRRDKAHYAGAYIKGNPLRVAPWSVEGGAQARRFNITDKVIIIFVRTTDINRQCQTHKRIIVASLNGGWVSEGEGGR